MEYKILNKLYGFTKAELKVFTFLLNNNKNFIKTFELTEKLNLDSSTIQRAVKNIYENGFLIKRQINLNTGGYCFLYQAKSKFACLATIKEDLISCSNTDYFKIINWINNN